LSSGFTYATADWETAVAPWLDDYSTKSACQSIIPALTNTEIIIATGQITPETRLSSVSSDFWTNSFLPLSANLPLWHVPFGIIWEEDQISTLTIWSARAGPDGAVVTAMDTGILNSYSPAFTILTTADAATITSNTEFSSQQGHDSMKSSAVGGLVVGLLYLAFFLCVGAFALFRKGRNARRNNYFTQNSPVILPNDSKAYFVHQAHAIDNDYNVSRAQDTEQGSINLRQVSSKQAYLSGRTISLHLLTTLVAVVLVLNVCFMILGGKPQDYGLDDPDSGNSVSDPEHFVVSQGACSAIKRRDTGLHAVINIFGLILLTAVGGFLTVLSSPHREHLDNAHAAGKWLDIGFPSVKNFKFLSRTRLILWMLLFLFSLPLHVL
jgi:hypothetical protein